MPWRDRLGPNSLDHIVYVILLWTMTIVVVTRVYDTPLLRLEIIILTGILLIWVVWGVHYRLEQVKQERFGRY